MKYPVKISAFFLCFVALLLFNACRKPGKSLSQEEIEINIDEKDRPLPYNIIEELIPLETSPDCLIGYVGGFKYFNHRFYLLDNLRSKAFFIFDEGGHLIKKTSKGKGPGEVVDPFAFALNKSDSLVLLHDQTLGSILTFDLDGKFMSSKVDPRVYILSFDHINRDTFLVYNSDWISDAKGIKKQLTYSLFTKEFSKSEHFDILLSGKKDAHIMSSPICIYGNEVLFTAPWNYNVYQLVGGHEKIRYNLNFGKYNFSPVELETLASHELVAQVNAEKRVGIISSLFKTKDFLVFRVDYGQTPLTYFLSFSDGKVYCLNDSFKSGSLPYCKIFDTTEEGLFYALVEPYNLIEFQKRGGHYEGLEVKDTDNPYIIKFSIINHLNN